MIYSVSASAPPVSPVEMADMKAWLRVNHTEDDAAISLLLVAACEAIEADTGLSLSRREWVYTAQAERAALARDVRLPRRRLSSVTSITVLSGATETTLTDVDDYTVTATGKVIFPDGLPLSPGDVIEVTFEAGYADPADVPGSLRVAIKRAVALNYDYRTDIVIGTSLFKLPTAEFDLLHPFRSFTV